MSVRTSPKYVRGAGSSAFQSPQGSALSIPGGYKGNDSALLNSKIKPSTLNHSSLSNKVSGHMPSSVRNIVLTQTIDGRKNHSALKLKPLQGLSRPTSGDKLKTQRNSSALVSPVRQVVDSLGNTTMGFGSRKGSLPPMQTIKENEGLTQETAMELVQLAKGVRLQQKISTVMKKNCVNSDFTEGYRQSGMTKDNSLIKRAQQEIVDKRAIQRAQQKNIIAQKRAQLRGMMKDDYHFDKSYVARQHFRDELNLLQQLKERHFELTNVQAAILIQKMWRGYKTRQTAGRAYQEKQRGAALISRIWRSKKRITTFRNLAMDYKNHAAIQVQAQLRGYLGHLKFKAVKRVQGLEELNAWLAVRRQAMLIDAQIKIAHAWRKFKKVLIKRKKLADKKKKQRQAKEALEKQMNKKGGTINNKKTLKKAPAKKEESKRAIVSKESTSPHLKVQNEASPSKQSASKGKRSSQNSQQKSVRAISSGRNSPGFEGSNPSENGGHPDLERDQTDDVFLTQDGAQLVNELNSVNDSKEDQHDEEVHQMITDQLLKEKIKEENQVQEKVQDAVEVMVLMTAVNETAPEDEFTPMHQKNNNQAEIQAQDEDEKVQEAGTQQNSEVGSAMHDMPTLQRANLSMEDLTQQQRELSSAGESMQGASDSQTFSKAQIIGLNVSQDHNGSMVGIPEEELQNPTQGDADPAEEDADEEEQPENVFQNQEDNEQQAESLEKEMQEKIQQNNQEELPVNENQIDQKLATEQEEETAKENEEEVL